jgi:hypothetical protein
MLKSLIVGSLALASANLMLAETEDSFRKSLPVESSKKLSLIVDFASIRVEGGSTGNVELEAFFAGNPPSRKEFDRMMADFSFDVQRSGSDLRVKGEFKNGWKSAGFGGYLSKHWCSNGKCLEYEWLHRMEIRARVPSQFATDLRTSGGSITVGDLGGETTARTSGGSLHFGHIDGPVNGETSGGSITLLSGKGRAIVHTSGGGIRIEDMAGEVEAETSGGSIEIMKTSGRVTARTSGGGIHIGEAVNAIDAETSGGGITVAMRSNAKFDIDAETSGGGVSSEFEVIGAVNSARNNRLRGAVNGGGPLLHLRTSGGGIHIRRAG